jgi:hypothetical protein
MRSYVCAAESLSAGGSESGREGGGGARLEDLVSCAPRRLEKASKYRSGATRGGGGGGGGAGGGGGLRNEK